MNVVVAPQGCTETARGILVVNADINLVPRLVEELARHVRVALVDRMEIGVTELARPMLVEFLLDLHLKASDLSLADVLKAVEHVGRVAKLLCCLEIRVKVYVVARVIGGHVVANRIAEKVQSYGRLFCLALDTNVKVDGLLRLQIRIACPVPAKSCTILIDGAAAVHFPVVVELSHTGFRIAGTEICFEAQMRVALDDIARETEICCHMCAEEAAVIEPQNGGEYGVIVHHPRIPEHEMILVDARFTNNDLILQRVLNLTEELAVQRIICGFVWIAIIRQPVKITVPSDEVRCVFGADLGTECIISCACTIRIDRV